MLTTEYKGLKIGPHLSNTFVSVRIVIRMMIIIFEMTKIILMLQMMKVATVMMVSMMMDHHDKFYAGQIIF